MFDGDGDCTLLPADVAKMKDFKPAAGGSLGELVGYASDVTDDEAEDGNCAGWCAVVHMTL